MFITLSPNRVPIIPSLRQRACLIGIVPLKLNRVDSAMIKKREQLTPGVRGIYWAIAKGKKGYSKISYKLKLLLLNAFNDHPQVVVSPNTKDTLQVMNADGNKTLVRKKLTMVGLRTIFLDIIRDNPTIKNKVGEHAFSYIISRLGCVHQFMDSHKSMCGCTKCVGLHALHPLLQAKRGVMHCQITIDAQCCMLKVRAKEMARGWGNVALHKTPSEAIRVDTCAQWSVHNMPYWECQMLQCGTCTTYPVPVEEAREDAGAEQILFHVYKYKVSLHQDSKEHCHLKLVWGYDWQV